MSELHPTTMGEQIRALGTACHCEACRGSEFDINTLISGLFQQQQAEIDRLTADRQALLDAANKTAELVMRQGQQSIEQQAEIDRLRARLAAVVAYCERNEPECDPYCCRELLEEVHKLAAEAGDTDAAR